MWQKLVLIVILLIIAIVLFKTDKPASNEESITYKKDIYSDRKLKDEEISSMKNPEFWINRIENSGLLLMDEGEINGFNNKNFRKEDSLMDLEKEKSIIDKLELTRLIESLSKIPKEKRYDNNGNIIDNDYYNNLIANLNLDSIDDNIVPKYAITINRTMLKTFPTFEPSYKAKNDIQFDRFMETAIYPWEPLIIYWESLDGEWYFGRMYNYIGWIPKKDIAIGDKEEIFNYINKDEFLIVVDKQIAIGDILYDMGVRIPLVEKEENTYIISIPIKDETGKLEITERKIDKSESFSEGYLPYTKGNIVLQAFKFLGEEYGWGGINSTRDCSAFIMDIHRVFGLKLPRNTLEQGRNTIGKTYNFEGIKSLEERLETLKELPKATALYMPNHTMLYLGEYEEEYYIIHQFGGYYEENNSNSNYIDVMKTAITPVTIKASPKTTYLESLYLGKEFINPD